jgi:hypothetical protein
MPPTLFPPNWATLNTRAKWRYVRRLQRLAIQELKEAARARIDRKVQANKAA